MGSLNIWHWAIVTFWLAVVLAPGCWRNARKADFHGAWSPVLLLPILNLLMVWVFAFNRWPAKDSMSMQSEPAGHHER